LDSPLEVHVGDEEDQYSDRVDTERNHYGDEVGEDPAFQNYSDSDGDFEDVNRLSGTEESRSDTFGTIPADDETQHVAQTTRERAQSIERSLDASLQNLRKTSEYFASTGAADSEDDFDDDTSQEEEEEEYDDDGPIDALGGTAESKYAQLVASLEASRRKLQQEIGASRRTTKTFKRRNLKK
jgi:hypothetical protein